jgi:hypothetical protein
VWENIQLKQLDAAAGHGGENVEEIRELRDEGLWDVRGKRGEHREEAFKPMGLLSRDDMMN